MNKQVKKEQREREREITKNVINFKKLVIKYFNPMCISKICISNEIKSVSRITQFGKHFQFSRYILFL